MEVDDSTQQDNVASDDSDGDSSMQVNVLIGACVVLLLALLNVMMRGPKSAKTPSGLPTEAEDEWLSKYTSKK